MSGGSFNYVSIKDADTIFEYLDDLEHMADALDDEGQHMLAVRTRGLIRDYREKMAYWQKEIDLMSPVWQAIEWFHSGDYGYDAVKEAINKYWHI